MKTAARGVEHDRGEVHCYRRRLRVGQFNDSQEASVASAEVEDAPHTGRNEFQKRGFAFNPVRNGVGAAQVVQSVFWRGPEVDAHAKSINSNSMNKLKTGAKGFPAIFLNRILVLLLLSLTGWAQAGQSADSQKAAGEGARATPDTEEQKISPQEAEKLFRSVDEILQFASRDTLFPIKHEVKRQLVSRDQVETYVTEHTSEDEDAKRLRRSELVLKNSDCCRVTSTWESFWWPC